MKKLFLIIIILCSMQGFTQKSDTAITYTGIIKTNDSTLTKDNLYLKGKEWFVSSFKSANDVIQLDDKENGMIQGKGCFSYYSNVKYMGQNQGSGYINFTIKLWVKNGRYKYEFSNFIHTSNGTTLDMGLITSADIPDVKQLINFYTKLWNDIKISIQSHIAEFIKPLNEKMNEKTNNGW
jgi:hypothetical protein